MQPRHEHRINDQIRVPKIRVVDEDGDQLGVMTPERGRLIARDRGLDLVEVAPNARPPVCRVLDYGRFRYEQAKKKDKGHQSQLKTIRLRPKIDDHDLDTKLRRVKRFLKKGDKVRLVMRLRGRERALTHRWREQLREIVDRLGDKAEMQAPPQSEGRAVSVTLEPVSA